MPSPWNCFKFIFFFIFSVGLLVAFLNFWNPDLVYVPTSDGTDNEGFKALKNILMTSVVLGTIFGTICAGIAWIFRRIVDG